MTHSFDFKNKMNMNTQANMQDNSNVVKTRQYMKLNELSKAVSLSVMLSLGVWVTFPAMAANNDKPSNEQADSVASTVNQSKKGLDSEAEHGLEPVQLTPAQRAMAGIEVVKLASQTFSLEAVATASLVVDRNRTVVLAPQLEVLVEKRHVLPGQEVVKGEPLLTLGGSAVAQAQSTYVTAAADWNRIKSMSKNAVSASRRLQSQVSAELARATLQALQMTDEQITGLEKNPNTIGRYQLLAPINGRVQQDIAELGQVIVGGTPLMQLTDESYLWVDAQLTPDQAEGISVGNVALVKVGKKTVEAKIIGRSHEFNSQTRTEKVVLSFDNTGHELHAGQFAEIYLPDAKEGGIVVPDSALTRSNDGDWQVYTEEPEGFVSHEIKLIESQRGMNLIRGIKPDSNVVISGAFFLASERSKTGFDADGH
ncbi:efflux RND transporter periplasmic adaptor subunit [uncultured Shewanella sp.]|uniref:efflux RND transporter periplasmic adaptor subunit n=1 Tax=uncultured Shewanella sp. TaxID=173975 RepID=UPI0026086C53|nr:efflux RND transporter periplasmic adaptor subunit [uncultured Shewanella sp.]